MSRGRLAVHAHFYQPSRLDPWTGRVPAEPSAAPFHDWNERVNAECYRPNAQRGNLARISFDLGPTLASWLAQRDPATHGRFVSDGAGAIGQAYHHAILPLASAADRQTEIAWGLRDFELRFGRRPRGMWLPETAVDLATLRELERQGVEFTILAPWQAAGGSADSRQPYRVDLGGGRSIIALFYDSGLSAAVSFEPEATADADRFGRDRVGTRFASGGGPIERPLALIATDGELYGHHQQFRDLFLQRLVAPDAATPDRGWDVVALDSIVDEALARQDLPAIGVTDRTSWSCHHGVSRWSGECPDAPDGRWKGPLRAAFERLAGAVDAVTEAQFATQAAGDDSAAARDAYVDVVVAATSADAFAAERWPDVPRASCRRLLELLEAQRWRLAMFASDGWYWDDPIRPETRQVMRAAARAARIVDGLAGSTLERRLVADLALLTSPSRGMDGATIYRMALADVGQAGPTPS